MSQNLCKSYLLELHQGIHVWGTDQMRLALYTPSAVLDPDSVTAYTVTNEVSGTGYTAGGPALVLASGFPRLSPTGARIVLIDFEDVALDPANGFTTRYGLIYNASKANRAVAVLDFGLGYVAVSSFGVVWPVADDNNAIIRLGA